jgi:hypothetical protein
VQSSMSEQEPAPKKQGVPLNLIVKDQLGQETHFKVKPTTKFEKVRCLHVVLV